MLPWWTRAEAQKPFVVAVHLFVSVKSYQEHLSAIHQLAFEACNFFLQLSFFSKRQRFGLAFAHTSSEPYIFTPPSHTWVFTWIVFMLSLWMIIHSNVSRLFFFFWLFTKFVFSGLQSYRQRASEGTGFHSKQIGVLPDSTWIISGLQVLLLLS